MRTVGKKILGIEYFWGRFEFAAMRGQIHLHLLTITEDKSIGKTFYNLRGDKEAQAKFMHEWSRGAFRMTAEVDNEMFARMEPTQEDNPCMKYLDEIEDEKREEDECGLYKFTMNHKCSGYCLRYSNGKRTSSDKKACR